MASTLVEYKTFADVCLQPITRLRFGNTKVNTDTETYDIYHLESESSYSITPILKADMKGGNRTLGYKAEITLYVMQNDPSNGLISKLENFRLWRNYVPAQYTDYYAILDVGDASSVGTVTPEYEMTGGKGFSIYLNRPEINLTVEGVAMRSRYKLTISKVAKNISDFNVINLNI